MKCPEHGVKTIRVPWAEPGSPFTSLYEALIIDWLRAANTRAVARLMGLIWDQVDGVMQRAVRRGLARRELAVPQHMGVDETSFQKRHEYVTVVADLDQEVVHHVADGRGKEALAGYYESFKKEELAMEMWGSRSREEAWAIFKAWYSWAKGLNTKIQWLKRSARGFRNRNRFRTAIYFHLGGLELYPASATHTNS